MMIGFIDSGPHWDDTGVTFAMILVATAFLGFVIPRRAWIWAITIGIWTPIWNMYLYNNYSSSISIGIAIFGAYLGVLFHKLLLTSPD